MLSLRSTRCDFDLRRSADDQGGVRVKRKYLLFPVLLLTLCIVLSPALFKAEAAEQKDLNALLEERQIDCWVEGEVFGDLILGSRGTIQFIYLDAKLSKAISVEQGLRAAGRRPEPVLRVARDERTFIANLEANKPWTVEEKKMRRAITLRKRIAASQAGRILSARMTPVRHGSSPLSSRRSMQGRVRRSWWATGTTS